MWLLRVNSPWLRRPLRLNQCLCLPKAELNTKNLVEFLVFNSICQIISVPSDEANRVDQWFFFCYTWRAICRSFFVILVKFSKVLLYLHLVILRPILIFLLYLFGYTWPLVKIFVIPGFVIPLYKYNKKNTNKRWFTDFSKI